MINLIFKLWFKLFSWRSKFNRRLFDFKDKSYLRKSIIMIFFLFSCSTAFATNISNADIDDEDMADITDWTDEDAGDGVSSQVTFDSKSCMKFDSGSVGGDNSATRVQDIGTFGSRTVFSINLYHDAIGTLGNNDFFEFTANDGFSGIWIDFCSNGLFIVQDISTIEIGTDLVVQNTWQEWTFDVNWVAMTVDVYLDKVLKASDINIREVSQAEGTIVFSQYGVTTANQITYIDWFKAGTDFVLPPTTINNATLNNCVIQ